MEPKSASIKFRFYSSNLSDSDADLSHVNWWIAVFFCPYKLNTELDKKSWCESVFSL